MKLIFRIIKKTPKYGRRETSAMGRHFNILIWIFMLKTTKEQVLFDDLEDRQQNSLNTAMSFIKNEQQSMEKILFEKLEEIEKNLQAKINTKIENVTKNIVENFTKILEYKLAGTLIITCISVSFENVRYTHSCISKYVHW